MKIILDSPDEQAEEFKKDGTFHFKHKLYKKAIIAYSKAIAVKPTDKKLLVSTGVPVMCIEIGKVDLPLFIKASCYNNRGASEYFLKNYRKAIKDSGMAVSIDQNYLKSWIRIFDSCEKLKLWNEVSFREIFRSFFFFADWSSKPLKQSEIELEASI